MMLTLSILLTGIVYGQQSVTDSILATIQDMPEDGKVSVLLENSKNISQRDPALSLEIAGKAHEISSATGDPVLMANTLNALSILNYYLGNNQASLNCLLEAIGQIKLAAVNAEEKAPLWFRLQSFHSNAGNVYQAMGDFEKALDMHQQALRYNDSLMQATNAPQELQAARIRTMNNIGVLYWNLGDPGRALGFLDQALAKGRESGNPSDLIFTLTNIGLVQADLQAYPEAERMFMEALDLGNQLGDSIGIAGNYNNLGTIKEKTGRYREALIYYLASYGISKRLGYSIGIANTGANTGRIYLELNRPDSALFFTMEAISEAREAQSKTYLLSGYEVLFRIYEKTGRYPEALASYKQYTGIKDSIFNEEKSRQIAEMEARFENEKKEKENQILRQKIALQQRNNLLILISTAALILFTFLLFNFYRLKNRSLKQKALLLEQEGRLNELEKKRLEDQLFAEQQINILQNEKLEQQNRELASRILHLVSKNEAMNRVVEEMDRYNPAGQEGLKECYTRIRYMITDNINTDKEWEQFKLHFEQVNPGFFHNLKQLFPELSQNELKLCAYYRINLGTKEIARMLNITPAAVQKSRHRLRKKMEIPSDFELPEFMSRF